MPNNPTGGTLPHSLDGKPVFRTKKKIFSPIFSATQQADIQQIVSYRFCSSY